MSKPVQAITPAALAQLVPLRIPHDFRRPAVRNLVRAGIHERQAQNPLRVRALQRHQRTNHWAPGIPKFGKPAATPSANAYDFTVIELRLNRRRGTGESKSSLFTKVTADKTAKTIILENYTGAKVVLKDVKALQKTGAATAQTSKPQSR